jgi:hypothetical protein
LDFTIGKISAINPISKLSKSETVALKESAFAQAKYITERGSRFAKTPGDADFLRLATSLQSPPAKLMN